MKIRISHKPDVAGLPQEVGLPGINAHTHTTHDGHSIRKPQTDSASFEIRLVFPPMQVDQAFQNLRRRGRRNRGCHQDQAGSCLKSITRRRAICLLLGKNKALSTWKSRQLVGFPCLFRLGAVPLARALSSRTLRV
jgi:hypothetical protein